MRSAAAPGALLAGDAAGFLDPFTGQGVYLALTDAERAAGAAATALRAPAAEQAAFREYAARRRRDLAARRLLGRAVALLVDVPPLAGRAAARLMRSPKTAAVLLDALAGAIPPQRALTPAVLGRLFV
ncbi:MAG: hypothetical protein JOZ24_09460 [Candidatus Eremiobacteraeota bacterium]|nr:hypothetical protein [Candidatus Eremiobacteraeota bacterium]